MRHPVGDYFPAYYEMAILSSLLEPHLARIAQVKLIPFCFDLLTAAVAYMLASVLQRRYAAPLENLTPRIVAIFTVLAGPTVIVNSAVMGQQDIDFTFFLLSTVLSVVAGSGALAPLFFGLAVAFKLQAIFLSPFLLAMILRRRIPWWSLSLLPVGWLLALTPPLLAGASLREYVTLPFTQMSEIPALAVNIGNPWVIANVLHLPARVGVPLGLIISACAGVAVVALGLRKAADTPRGIVAVAAVSLLTMPYVMPKMHDRYFFPAELLLSILACVDLRFLMPAALVIAASLISYAGYFTEYAHHPGTALSLMATTLALYTVVRYAVEVTTGKTEVVEQPSHGMAVN
jgi:Gpi18-like mannosyltransferase